MNSTILSVAVRFLLPLLILFSMFILFRGHNEPGGGFIGGLMAAAAFALYAIAHTAAEARRLLHIPPMNLIAAGLLAALVSGLVSLVLGSPFMTGLWSVIELPVIGKLGTPLLFDIGVYLVVVGVALLIIFSLAED
jgi:multicomponent Na+:H+ antiporter subunit B